jgi:hypothetical protein
MEQDKKLQSLLIDHGMQRPSVDFDDKVMQRISAIKSDKSASTPLISPALKRILMITFAIAALALFIVAFLVQPGIFSNYLSISLSEKMYSQAFSFFVAFWIVMFLNTWWQTSGLINIDTENL